MKKLFFLSAFLIFACSSDDSSNTNDDNDNNNELLNCDGNPVPTIIYGLISPTALPTNISFELKSVELKFSNLECKVMIF